MIHFSELLRRLLFYSVLSTAGLCCALLSTDYLSGKVHGHIFTAVAIVAGSLQALLLAVMKGWLGLPNTEVLRARARDLLKRKVDLREANTYVRLFIVMLTCFSLRALATYLAGLPEQNPLPTILVGISWFLVLLVIVCVAVSINDFRILNKISADLDYMARAKNNKERELASLREHEVSCK